MDLSKWLNDERLLANLIGIHVVLAVVLFVSIVFRKLLKNGGEQFVRWTGLHWLDGISKEAVKAMRSLLFWCTVTLMIVSVASTGLYHASGHDIRKDLRTWMEELSSAHLFTLSTMAGKLVLLALSVTMVFRILRRVRVFCEVYVHHHLPRHVHPETAPHEASTRLLPFGETPHAERRQHLEGTIKRWFLLLQRFGMAIPLLAGLWLAGHIIGFHEADAWAHLVLRILAYYMVARLLTLGCRTMFHVFANIGNRYFEKGHLHRYWERIVRLFPFGERCFEAAVWIFAASQCAEALSFIAFIATFGTGIVQCIGIFFGTRVAIELLHVFINEAFGMYETEDQPADQKGQTLVPLLESLSLYVLYFGSVLMMLRVFQIDTTPILAGAGVIGLAVGLGAQNFVTDLVSDR